MPNQDRPRGFRPYGKLLRANPYNADATIYPGDGVKLKSDGQVEVVAAGAAGWVGVALSYATAGNDVLVADDPNQLFIAQADDSTIDAQTDLLLNYNVVATAGNSTYKQSRMEIDASTQATDSNLPIKVLRLLGEVNNALGDNCDVICKINNHQLGSGTGTLGV